MIPRDGCTLAVNRAFIGLPLQYHGELFDQRVYGSRKTGPRHMARKLDLIRPIKKIVYLEYTERICFLFARHRFRRLSREIGSFSESRDTRR